LAVEALEDRTAPALVAAYGFEEAGGSVAVDSSGANNPGTISGPTRTVGRFGQGLAFNGVNSWVTVAGASSLNLTTGMTLEAWVYPTDSNGWETVVLKERGTTGLAYALYGSDDAGRPPAGYVNVGGIDRSVVGPSPLPLDTWSHLAVTYDGSTMRLYVNADQVASRNQTGSVATSGDPLWIGGNAVWGEYFDGSIDEVRVYYNALTQAEIQTDMNTPVVPGPPDTIPPTVSITAPTNGATVSGVTTVSADATDNVGVAAVQFQLDGASLGVEDTTAPYSISWNMAGVANGSHTLTAVARDAAGNIATSTAIQVNVNNSSPSGTLTVDGSQLFQRIDGFGANLNSAAWGAGDVRPALDTLLNQMGANIFRVVVEPVSGWEDSDPNTGQYSNSNPNWPFYNQVYSSPKFTNLWNTISYLNDHNATVLLNIQGYLPAWMSNPDHTVPASHEDDWVTMLTTLLYYGANTAHVRIDQFGPMNEPDNSSDPVQGPQVQPAQYIDMMDRLIAKMQALGLGGIQLVGPDCANTGSATSGYMPAMFNDPTLMADVYHFGIHTYSGESGSTDPTVSGSGWAGRDWWADEYADWPTVDMDHGQPLPASGEWNFAENSFQDLLALIGQGASGAMVWDGVDSFYELENSWTTWGQLSYDQSTQTYAPRLRLYANGMVDKFVTPGSYRVAVSSTANGLVVLAFYNPATGQITIVGENTNGSPLSLSGNLTGGPSAQRFEEYFTNADAGVQMQRQADVAVTGNTFTFQIPAHTIFTLTLPPPAIESVVINSGAAQRSRVTQTTVTFDTQVDPSLLANAFTLTRSPDGATVGTVGVTVSVVNGKTVAGLTFSGTNTDFGSLADGRWTLTVDHTKVRSADGVLMTADFTQHLHRLFGDSDGNGNVDVLDLANFRQSFGTISGQPGYVDYFDFDANGTVDVLDLAQFRQRFGHVLP
jgi:O-glycosyl hydrolase